MKTSPFLILFLFLFSHLHAQIWDWGRYATGSTLPPVSNRDQVFTAVDRLGNILVTGSLFDTATVGNIILPAKEGFVAKFDAHGGLLWTQTLAPPSCGTDTEPSAVEVDFDGNVYVAYNCFNGFSNSTFSIRKFNPQGNILWTEELAGENAYSEALAIGDNGEIAVTGYMYSGFPIDSIFLGGVGIREGSRIKPFIFKLDANGNGLWGATNDYGGQDDAFAQSIAIDKDNNVYLAGKATGPLSFGPGISVNPILQSAGEIFLVKFDDQGAPIWGRFSNYTNRVSASPEAHQVSIHPNGNVVLSGDFRTYLNWDTLRVQTSNNWYGQFLLSLKPDGQPDWINFVETEFAFASDWGDMVIDTLSGEMFLTGVGAGAYLDTFYVDHSNCGTSSNTLRPHVAAFDSLGQPRWLIDVPCFSSRSLTAFSSSIATDHRGEIYLSGVLENGVFSLDTLNFPNRGNSPYLAKLLREEIVLEGQVFRDFNGNGIKDSIDTYLPNLTVESDPLKLVELTGRDGDYAFKVDINTHEITLPTLPQHHTLSLPNSQPYVVNATAGGQVLSGYDFGTFPIPGIKDLEILLTPLSATRPGFFARYRLSCWNVGSVPIPPTLTYTHEDQLRFLNSSIPFTSYDSSLNYTLTWALDTLAPYDTVQFDLEFILDRNTFLGVTLASFVEVLPILGDVDTLDNRDTLRQTVTGSFDPNDKTALSGELLFPPDIANQKPIDYLIRFQNVGTDTAFTVIIRDSFSTSLEWSSFQMVDASDPYTFQLDGNGLATWRFDNILLPDSLTDEEGSQGFVRYRIKPDSNLMVGSRIDNKAAIYFDYNKPIITNTSQVWVVNPVDTLFITNFTCDSSLVGVDSLTLMNRFGLDSLVLTSTFLTSPDTTYLQLLSCDPARVGMDSALFINRFGCDSLVLTATLLARSDTTLLQALSCDPKDVGVDSAVFVNQFGCDSLVLTNILLARSDTTLLQALSCDPKDVGVDSAVFVNQLGCDSLVLTNTLLARSDTTQLQNFSCDPNEVGFEIDLFKNQFGCDSSVFISTILLISDTTYIDTTSSDSAELGIRVDTLTNQFGCDSLVITNTRLVTSLLPDSSPKLDLKLFPNPGKGLQNLEIEVPANGNWTLEVMNIQGFVIKSHQMLLPIGKHFTQQDWRYMPRGLYLIILSNGNQRIEKRWVKE